MAPFMNSRFSKLSNQAAGELQSLHSCSAPLLMPMSGQSCQLAGRRVQTVSCPQRSLDYQESLPCFSTQSQPAPTTKIASSLHSEEGIIEDSLSSFIQAFEKDKQAVDQDKPALKKAGRPVEYQGDINSPALSTSERCRIKRRIVNREAARRLRERRQESLDSAQDKVGELKQRNRKLKLNLQERRTQRKELQGRVQHADSQWSQAAADYEHLQASVHSMRCSLEASLQMIEKQRTPNQPLFSGQAPFLSPTRPHPRDRVQGIEGLPLEVARHSPAESALSHEGLQASYLSSCAPSFVARESLGTPPHWTKVLAGQQPQGILEQPQSLASGVSSIGRAPCMTGSAGGSATIRDLLINQSCREAASEQLTMTNAEQLGRFQQLVFVFRWLQLRFDSLLFAFFFIQANSTAAKQSRAAQPAQPHAPPPLSPPYPPPPLAAFSRQFCVLLAASHGCTDA
ncbi:TPA: hypothetical protein ACH3X3_010833 [Trebouxia sp. C0006]